MLHCDICPTSGLTLLSHWHINQSKTGKMAVRGQRKKHKKTKNSVYNRQNSVVWAEIIHQKQNLSGFSLPIMICSVCLGRNEIGEFLNNHGNSVYSRWLSVGCAALF